MLRTRKRIEAVLLAAALLIGQLGATVYAEGPPATGSLCEHHPAHDAECGYVEAVPGHDCEHEHTVDCYTGELICGIDEDAEQTSIGGDAGHQHGQECYALDCPHKRGKHDDACGYSEAVTETPCSYVCGQCGKEPDKDSSPTGTTSGNDLPIPGEPDPEAVQSVGAAIITVTTFDELDSGVKYQSLPLNAPESDIRLPAALGASGYTVAEGTELVPAPITITGVTWELTGEKNTPTTYEDVRTTPCSYYFQPVLPEGYTLAGDAVLPKIEVRYGWAARANISDYDTSDVRIFQAILDAHPSLASGNVDRADPASWTNAGILWSDTPIKRIKRLNLFNKNLTGELDVSGLTGLTLLNCGNNQLTGTLNVGGLTGLTYLNCGNNQLTGTLNVGGLTELTYLNCADNQLTGTLNVGGLTRLTELNCNTNQLTGTLDLGGMTGLTYLDCSVNQFSGIVNTGGLTQLGKLICYDNRLEGTLDVSGLTGLTYLNCSNNQLEGKLDVGGLMRLKNLYCYDNRLTGTLDVKGLSQLTELFCRNNRFEGTLDVGGLNGLAYLDCSSNQFTALEGVNQLTQLLALNCRSNPFVFFQTKDGHVLTIDHGAGGTVVMTDFDFSSNSVELTAIPDSGHYFKEWMGLPKGASNDAIISFNVDSDTQVRACFSENTISVTGVTLDYTDYTLYTDKDPRSFRLSAAVTPDNASDKSVSWTSSNSGVVSVDTDGTVTAHTVGTAVITATTSDSGKTAVCNITVKGDTPSNSGSSSSGGNPSSDDSPSSVYEPQSSYTAAGDRISVTNFAP